ncbi:MAG: hypothetical protein ABR591_10510 [Candidatus Velthaea sp.]
MNTTIETLRLGTDADAARGSLTAAVDRAVAAGTPSPRVAVTLTGESVPAPMIAVLVAALRKIREHGGAIVVSAESDDARAALRITGLDRVFALPLVDARDEARPARRPRSRKTGMRAAAAGLATLVALTAAPATAQAPQGPSTDPAAIITRITERNPSVATYQSRLHVDLRLTSFPFLRQHLDGSTYFKRPNNYEVVFDRVPSYAKGFEKLYSDIGDPSNWEKKFVVTYAGERQFENRKDLELRLVQRVRGMIDHETVLIDPNGWTIDQMEYHYYNGGVITMTQHFSNVAGSMMIVSQDAHIDIPHVRAVAHGTYDEYKTNVAIDDAVFTKNH